MGHEIVYCTVCQTRLLGPDFEKRKAFRIQGKPSCAECAGAFIESLPADERAGAEVDLAAQKRADSDAARKGSTGRIPKAAETPRRGTDRVPRAETPKRGTERIPKALDPSLPRPAEDSSSALAWMGGIGAVVALGLIAAVLSSGSSGSTPDRARSRPEDPPVIPLEEPKKPAIDPHEAAAVRALAEARTFLRNRPEDISGALPLYEKAVYDGRGTSLLADAQREYQALQTRAAERVASELNPLLLEIRQAARKEAFARSATLIGQARARHAWPDWIGPLDREARDLQEEEERLFASIVDEAEEARRRGDEKHGKTLDDRVGRWGLPARLEALRRAVAVIPPPKVESPEVKKYRDRWEHALARAAVRNYPEAIQELEAALKEATLPELRGEIATDLELARAASDVLAQALDGLSKSAKGRKLSLELEAAGASRDKVDGAFERWAGTAAELKRENDTVMVEASDLSARTIVELAGPVDGPRVRGAKAFLLIEGETNAAGPHLPAKYAEFAARVRRLFPIAKEDAAHAAWAAAEREFADPANRVLSADAYRKLLEGSKETRFVGRKRTLIAARMAAANEAGRDYVFLVSDMAAAGAFQSAAKKGETAWTSQSDVPGIKDNYVEISFHALASVEYRAWALVGGCCMETFAYSVQGSEMTAPLPDRPAERASAEPGQPLFLPGKLPSVFLKRLHSMHGGPKAPARYEWVPLALPKYAAAGRKSIRILSGQQGFSVRCIVVSATREAPPGEADLKQIERSRPPVPPTAVQDPSLVAHWRFDEGGGGTALDSVNGLAGSLRNNPTWSTGRIGGALAFNGINQCVTVPGSPKLHFPGPFTVAAWINPADTVGKYRYIVADYNDKGNLSSFGLRLSENQAIFFWENPSGTFPLVQSRTAIPAGRWTHLAGTWDGTARKLHVNGVLEATESSRQARPTGLNQIAIGRAGGFDGLYFLGEIDDVRLYSRALGDAEVAALVRAAARR